MHDNLAVGSQVQTSDPLNNFPLMAGASNYTLIAGGIGITPILSMARYLERTGAEYSLHYCARNPERAAFREILGTTPFSRRTVMHFDGEHSGQRLDLASLLRGRVEGQQVYCCGPAGLIDGVRAATWDWPANSVHFERFKIDPTLSTGSGLDSTFEIEIDSTGQILDVPPQKSILHVLRENGIFPDSSCEEGICGTCATGLLGGTADHRDFVLTDEEKASQTVVMICCSRANSRRLKLDL
ncbi:PDR/VanB family oxidoreductase [Mesorhizobium sp. M0976]|uniref:PDR/VanB family oxidoreductase n=1 Tax=Mesorhizobium sp. M0976 TaxID=2957038 RepID=UPI00333D7144